MKRDSELQRSKTSFFQDGLVVISEAVSLDLLENARKQILQVLAAVTSHDGALKSTDCGTFEMLTTELLWKMATTEPQLRSRIYENVQRIPALYQISAEEIVFEFSKMVGIGTPLVREAKVQMFLPWEPMFFQECHQDINSLESERSVTFWIPLAPLPVDRAVRYWVGSHGAGPVEHEIVENADAGIFLERVPAELQEQFPEVRSAHADVGDVIALNRLLFHQSPEFENQALARWSIVLRLDDLDPEALRMPGPKYAQCIPYTPEQAAANTATIRQRLKQSPVIDWPSKYRTLVSQVAKD